MAGDLGSHRNGEPAKEGEGCERDHRDAQHIPAVPHRILFSSSLQCGGYRRGWVLRFHWVREIGRRIVRRRQRTVGLSTNLHEDGEKDGLFASLANDDLPAITAVHGTPKDVTAGLMTDLATVMAYGIAAPAQLVHARDNQGKNNGGDNQDPANLLDSLHGNYADAGAGSGLVLGRPLEK